MNGHDDFIALTKMLGATAEDVDTCHSNLVQTNSAFWKRTYVRSLFAAFEALVHFMKQHALSRRVVAVVDSFRSGQNELPVAELSLLFGVSYHVDETGEVKIREAKIPFLADLQFSLRQAREVFGATHNLEKDPGWEALRAAVKIRDRVTHPKTLQEIEITDAEIETVNQAYAWIRREVARLFASIPGVSFEEVKDLDKLSEEVGTSTP